MHVCSAIWIVYVELQTYESNLTRLNVSSKSGSSLLSEIERKRDALIADIHLVEQKLALLVEKERQSEVTE